MRSSKFRVGVDTGGTFTDLVLVSPDGGVVATHKLPSTPSDPSVAVLSGIDALLAGYAERSGVVLSRDDVDVTHGSTVATNALLEMVQRRDMGVVFVTTAGFEDLVFLGRQHRPDLYALVPKRATPPVLRERCVGVAERMAYDGSVLEALSDEEIDRGVEQVSAMRPSAVAVCFLHAYVNPGHEARLAAALRGTLPGDVPVTVSSELLPVRREFERSAACVINAAVGPAMGGYLSRLKREVGHGLTVMGSHGGTMSAEEAIEQPVRTILSGPAGGVAGVAGLVRDAVADGKLVTLDMGGTSTDVCLVDVEAGASLSNDHEAAGLPVAMPMVDVHAIGAGGGSIAWVDGGGALRVGPRSAGAEPGPAAYGKQAETREQRRGDELASGGWWPTVTDAHVVLGHIDGSATVGGLTLSVGDACAAVAALAERLGVSSEEAARGILSVADAAIARAVRRVSLARGHDPRNDALVAFGGAGGLHACSVAELLGMRRVVVPMSPGLTCAAGMLVAPRRRTAERSVEFRFGIEKPLRRAKLDFASLRRTFEELQASCRAESEQTRVALSVEVRYADQTHTLSLDASVLLEADDPRFVLRHTFGQQHARRFGWQRPDGEIVITHARCVADRAVTASFLHLDKGSRRVSFGSEPGLRGPMTIPESTGTVLVPAGWTARLCEAGTILIERGESSEASSVSTQSEVISSVELEVFRELFAAAAEDMGETLMRCASSPNITERLDHSCAVFDVTGAMIAQAAHIPVHLGSAPASVRAVIAAFPAAEMNPEDRFLLNDPFAGGTHLPDVTVVAPVFLDDDANPSLFVAARAHHADVGGDEPGSMGLSTTIDQEGVRLGPTRWSEATIKRFAEGSRTPDERYADLKAQAAAVDVGATRLIELARSHGRLRLLAAGEALLEHARRLTNAMLERLPEGTFGYGDVLDGDGITDAAGDAAPINLRCTLRVARDQPPTLDFSESDSQVAGPMNATRSIVESAVLYALRLACGAELPNNSGILKAVRIQTRPGSVVDARPPAAVAGGNVETSQRLVDVVLGVLDQAMPGRLPADSCGSMNNVVIGSQAGDAAGEPFAYYETLAGGAGAGPEQAGGDAVHTHMTNTRNTPIEALEARFPLRITKYAIREASGGSGEQPGGRGIVRHYAFLRPARLTLLLERRSHAPRGRRGGSSGASGTQVLRRKDGAKIVLPAKCAIDVQAGDTLEIETPGGAGWGRP
ncbi:MAG: hydantoinase B/oxoprolinase family protein [Planctomycetota bacterium]